jgi:glycosyltransferase involved in cell wall biosynthesis
VDACAPDRIVYDVMDDLTSFSGASPRLRLAHLALLHRADVVFTGGRSLHAGVVPHRRERAHCFPSGVDAAHYRPAIARRRRRWTRVAGYVGVIDERVDLDLVEDIADAMPDWRIEMVGPVTKIDPATLPRRRNIAYLGHHTYDQLPGAMARFDVALMPFALNEATRSISPTKTLEYLAAGLPVVSTRVPDVVSDFGDVVRLCDNAPEFSRACRALTAGETAAQDAVTRALLQWHEWDSIVERMQRILVTSGEEAVGDDEKALA